ncbi:branched-chain amino acid ABC transporter permease [Miniimonas arenae]|uniref:branched-chain amino acid ABC transporter permease n=1 Tax=Miniimonas arenae TaxID=676201 RepID=UPI0028A58C84|nr:branched-chain amino acid ABC transporter permease [Miniimonas arenae]
MQVIAPPGAHVRRRLVLLVLALLTALALPLLASGAAPARADSAGPCTPAADVACIGGTIRTAAGDPAVGVVLTIEGSGDPITATTDDTGRWSAQVPEAGEYTVTLDVATLPAGESPRDGTTTRTVTAELGKTKGALFPLGAAGAGGGATSGATATASASADDSASADASAAATVPPGSATDETGSGETGGAGTNRVLQLILAGIIFGTLLALAAVGANLIYGTTGLSNFAHGDLVTLGGLIAFASVQWWHLPVGVAILVAVVAGGAAGWLLNAGIFAPLRRKRIGITQQMIVTIGLALALLSTYMLFFGANPLPIVRTISTRLTIGPVQISEQSLWSLLIAGVVLGAVAWVLQGTRVGRATRAVADNPALAAASGIKVESIIRGVWITAGALAALGGVLVGLYLSTIRFNTGSALLLLMFAAITLGGLGSPLGGLIGALIIGLVVELSTLVLPNDMRYASALVILIVVLLVRPQGILGRAERIG